MRWRTIHLEKGGVPVKPWMTALRELAWLTQLGFSLVTPPFLCAWGAWWLIDAKGFPAWVMLPALGLGLGAAGASFWGVYRYVQRKSRPGKKGPAAFNDHV